MLGLQRLTGNVTVRLSRRVLFRGKASVATEPQGQGQLNAEKVEVKKPAPEQQNKNKQKGTLVAAAFQSLKEEIDKNSSNQELAASSTAADAKIDERIINAKSVNGLLAITDGNGPLSRKHALKIVSILAEWSSINRVKLAEFENDQRFLRICRMLGRTLPKSNGNATNNNNTNNNNGGVSQKRITGFRTDDLNTVLGVAGDDEAAKLIASISLPQMVKVMSALAQKKRRSTPLLRSLAFNISSSTEVLDIKQCADVLFAMATLNFQDSVLSAKVCADIQLGLTKLSDKSAVVGSILTSLGILRYRDLDILEALTQWSLKHSDICRPQDLSALFLSSAMLNFKSTNLEDVRAKLARIIVPEDFPKKYDWLNHVWALSMLGIVDQQQLDSVLNESFVKQLEDKGALTPTSKMKLLNLNSYASLLAKDYKGSVLAANSSVYNVPMAHSKSKQVLLNGMLDALKSLLPANNHVQNLVDSKMGFLIDAVCQFDSKRNPVPLDKTNPDTIKVALMVIDFHDVCQGTHRSASGITNLTFDLLEKSGYKILPVPYNEFNTSDKLLKRVQYLDNKFKALISKQQK